MMKPTVKTYAELQLAYDTFNARLFGGQLPECLITLQREKRTYGYFSADRFGNRNGETIDEIALNPSYFAVVPIVEIMQTLAHEMVHLWQYHFGTPGRGRYHNGEWAEKMEALGLMPSSTGKPGGKRTGDCIADYPLDGGRFLQVCCDLLTRDYQISWYDRFAPADAVAASQSNVASLAPSLPPAGASIPAISGVQLVQASASAGAPAPGEVAGAATNKSNRSKYTCCCNTNLWGKPGLKIQCCECGQVFVEFP